MNLEFRASRVGRWAAAAAFEAALLGSAAAQSPPISVRTPDPNSTRGEISFTFVPASERRPVVFERIRQLIAFRLTIQGREVWAILDNGARSSLVDVALARELGLPDGPPLSPSRTVGGQAERHLVRDADIVIPGQMRYHTPLAAVDLAAVTRAMGRPIGLIVGGEIFNNFTFVVYSSRNSFELGPSGRLRVPDAVPFATVGPDGAVDAVVNGEHIAMTVDLGLSSAIGLSPDAWTRAGLDRLPFREESGSDGLGNRYPTRGATVPAVAVGPFVVRDVDAQRQPIAAVNREGLIGSAFLSRFDFALDLKTGRLWLLRSLDASASALTPPPASH